MSENMYNQAAHSGAVNMMDYVDKIEKFLESLLDKFNRWQADTYKDILLSDIFGIEKSELKDYSLHKVNGISEDSLNALCQQYGISDYIISRDIDGQMYFAIKNILYERIKRKKCIFAAANFMYKPT